MNYSYPNPFIYLLLCVALFSVSCNGQSNLKVPESKIPALIATPEVVKPYVETDSLVCSIFEDSKGHLWFGRSHAGLSRYDGNSFTHFSIKDGLSDNQIRTIQEDIEGNLWFATGNGISKYDGKKFTTHTSNGHLLSPLKTRNQWPKATDGLWFNGEKEGGIYRYNNGQMSVYDFPITGNEHESFSIKGTVTGISHGKNNMLWMANYGGVIGYDGDSFTYINEKRFAYHVRSIFQDSKGNLWIGNNGIGVLLYDGDTTINFTEQHGVGDNNSQGGGSLSPKGTLNHVFAIAEDSNGNIWFGDRDTGAWRYDGKSLTNYTLEDGLTNTFVSAIYQDKKGNLLLGLGDGSVCRFNGKTFDKVY